ncbi:MAG: porin [Rhodobacter sp.]|nr:porin [Rhodobacter sp.]
MKNLLLASTALVAFAGAAAAEVAISGSGRLGIVYNNSILNDNLIRSPDGGLTRSADSGFLFSSRVRVVFTLTQETDAGVSFGASIRADNASAGNEGKAGSVFMSGAFGKISMGDVDGAAESAVGNVSGVGYTNLNDLNEAFYLQQGNSDLNSNEKISEFALPAALYEYSTGGFTGYVALGNPAGIDLTTAGRATEFFDTFIKVGKERKKTKAVSNLVIDAAYGLGAKYSVDNYSVGLGYESIDISGIRTDFGADGVKGGTDDTESIYANTIDNWIIGGSATFSGFTLKAQYGEGSGDTEDITQFAFSGDYTFDAWTLTAFYRDIEVKRSNGLDTAQTQPFGFGVTYDLGGGASIEAGAVDPDRAGEDYRADFGVNFSF